MVFNFYTFKNKIITMIFPPNTNITLYLAKKYHSYNDDGYNSILNGIITMIFPPNTNITLYLAKNIIVIMTMVFNFYTFKMEL